MSQTMAEHVRHLQERLKAAEDRLDLVKREAAAIADALGERGLIDFADDVRMLTKL